VSENPREGPQDLISNDVAEGIVVVFEGVQIEQDEGQFPPTASRRDFSLQVNLEIPSVG
jgi:hypothetical protein